jgi:DNA (cytosine-5)-methyltransferase 1
MPTGKGDDRMSMSTDRPTAIGLFAGIGGIELGLHRAGFQSRMLCEIMPEAVRVLKGQPEFADVPIEADVRELAGLTNKRELNKRLPPVDVLSAGFPCQDLSQVGGTAGIRGTNSGLAASLLKILDVRKDSPRWVLIENVPFMLQLDRGKAMSYLTENLEELGMRWAYRVVDTRSFGIPQRRQRVVLLASRTEDPRPVLFADDAEPVERSRRPNTYCGFYWTEGNRGLGWAIDAVPTLKGGSTVGIPSPPAVWAPGRDFVGTPQIEDAERLQGFPVDWTRPAVDDPSKRNGPRWKLVGNAVTVDLSHWVGRRLREPGSFDDSRAVEVRGDKWPDAAYGEQGRFWTIEASRFPLAATYQPLGTFLSRPLRPLSIRATSGFLSRFERSQLRKPTGFVDSLRSYLDRSEVEHGAAV